MRYSVGEFNVGDVITAYHKGYYVVTRVDPRPNNSDLLRYVLIARSNGIRIKSKQEKACDASYCRRVTQAGLAAVIATKQSELDREREGYNNLCKEFHIDLE